MFLKNKIINIIDYYYIIHVHLIFLILLLYSKVEDTCYFVVFSNIIFPKQQLK